MLERRTVLGMAAMLLIGLLMTTPSFSQEQQTGQREQRGSRQGQRGQRRDRQDQRGQGGQLREGQGQRQGGAQGRGQQGQRSQGRSDAERMQERLGATEAEWKVLGPRVMKVSELSRQLRGGGRGNQRGGSRGGRPDSQQNAPARQPSAIEVAQEQLRALLDNTSATPGQIRQRVAALRTARKQVQQQLVVAQKNLIQIVTVRQEAQLIIMGLLD